jgi:hypothetical protein
LSIWSLQVVAVAGVDEVVEGVLAGLELELLLPLQ